MPSGNLRDLEERLAEALKLKTEALEQQAATAEILRVISGSPADVQPVFDSIIAAAVRLLRAEAGMLTRIIGDEIHPVAHVNQRGTEDPVVRAAFPRSLRAEGNHRAGHS